VPLLYETEAISEAQVEAILEQHREEIEEQLARIRSPAAPVTHPASLLTAGDLAEDMLELIRHCRASGTSAALRRAVANASYDVVVALVTLYKSAVDAPIVPRRRVPSGAASARA
jgi:hypothetical protein